MDIETKYAVKLFFPSSTFLQIYLEAIANAFDAEASEVTIHISTDGQISPSHLEITISDNGIGFTDERFDRFRRVKEPCDPYHKGLGRLVYLQYFSSVNVTSIYEDKKRSFTFSNNFMGDSETKEASDVDQRETVLRFNGFLGVRLKSYDDLKPSVLKERILEHFLPIFYDMKKAEKKFKIKIELETRALKQIKLFPDSLSLTVADVPFFEQKTIRKDSISAFDEISMSYVLREGIGEKRQLTAVCIDGRTIPIKLLPPNSIPPNNSAIFLFESALFGKSDSSRQRFVLPDSISEATLFCLLRREMSAVLNAKLPDIARRNTETRQRFEERYPHLLGFFEEDTVGIIDKDEAIEIAQHRFFKDQKKVLEGDLLDEATFKKSLEVSSQQFPANY